MELLQESGEQSHGHEDAVTAQSAAARELIEEVSPDASQTACNCDFYSDLLLWVLKRLSCSR